jgi:hypothetical protein
MRRYFRTYLLAPAAAAILVIGLTGCNNQGNSPRDSEKAEYAPNGNGASPGGGAGTGGGGAKAGSENGQPAGNSGSGGSTAGSGNGGAGAGGSGGEASTPTSRP